MKLSNNLSPEQLLQQSQLLHQEGKFKEAAQGFEKLRKLYPSFPPVLNSLGTIYLQSGRTKDGLNLLEQSLSIEPNQPMILFNLGLALQAQNKIQRAIDAYNKAIKLKSNLIDAMNARGIAFHGLKKYMEAISSYHQALEINPQSAELYNNLGISLLALNQNFEAFQAFEKSISLNPNNPQTFNNMGLALKKLNRAEESIVQFNRAIALNNSYADAYSNRGLSHQALNETEAALKDFDKCEELDPINADNLWNKALLKILIGDFVQGWKLYEYRWKSFAKDSVREFKSPLWLGKESLNNKVILIYPEQGYGDYIQFFRFIPLLKNLGAKIILEVRPALLELISSQNLDVTIIETGKKLPHFDFQCPIMSLALAFRTELNNIPNRFPYITIEPEKVSKWAQLLGIKNKPRIGLAWSGSVQHNNDHNRSICLTKLAPLLKLPFEFHSLQIEYRENDLDHLDNLLIHNHADDLNDFSDTAALIENLDLVISVDTAIAHLSGALNKEVWLMLPKNPDYRWMLKIAYSAWYPSASIFRQSKVNEWDSVLESITHKLLTSYC